MLDINNIMTTSVGMVDAAMFVQVSKTGCDEIVDLKAMRLGARVFLLRNVAIRRRWTRALEDGTETTNPMKTRK